MAKTESKVAGTLLAIRLINACSGSECSMRCPVDGTRVTAVVRDSTISTVRLECTLGLLKDETSHAWSIPGSMARAWRRKILDSQFMRRRGSVAGR